LKGRGFQPRHESAHKKTASAAEVEFADARAIPRYASSMRNRYIGNVLRCTILFADIALCAQQATQIPVTIRVSDPKGTAIANAQVRIEPSPADAPARLIVDGHGKVSLNLTPGDYMISASAPGFTTASRHMGFGVGDGVSTSAQTVSIVLQPRFGSPAPVYSAETLLLAGDHTSFALTPEDFRALPYVTITVHNGHSDANETYAGVPLYTLLAKMNAPSGKDLRGEAMTSYLVATGSDGYAVVLSLAEVDSGFRDTQVIVADSRDGQSLGKDGPFQLIVPEDKRPARWVHNLISITLQHAH
jgi:hypothetical protein